MFGVWCWCFYKLIFDTDKEKKNNCQLDNYHVIIRKKERTQRKKKRKKERERDYIEIFVKFCVCLIIYSDSDNFVEIL